MFFVVQAAAPQGIGHHDDQADAGPRAMPLPANRDGYVAAPVGGWLALLMDENAL